MQKSSSTSAVSTPCHWTKSDNAGSLRMAFVDLRLMVAPLSIKDFAALVEKARVMEKMKVEVETQHSSQQRLGGPSGSRHRHEERRKPYTRPHFQS